MHGPTSMPISLLTMHSAPSPPRRHPALTPYSLISFHQIATRDTLHVMLLACPHLARAGTERNWMRAWLLL